MFSGRVLSTGRRYLRNADKDDRDSAFTSLEWGGLGGVSATVGMDHAVMVSPTGEAMQWGFATGREEPTVQPGLPGRVWRVASALHFTIAMVEPVSEPKCWVDPHDLNRRQQRRRDVATSSGDDAITRARAALALSNHTEEVLAEEPSEQPVAAPPSAPAPPAVVTERKRVGGGYITLSSPFARKKK